MASKSKTTHTKANPLVRNGEALAVLPKGDPRRLSDARNAYRKADAKQRAEIKAWIASFDKGETK